MTNFPEIIPNDVGGLDIIFECGEQRFIEPAAALEMGAQLHAYVSDKVIPGHLNFAPRPGAFLPRIQRFTHGLKLQTDKDTFWDLPDHKAINWFHTIGDYIHRMAWLKITLARPKE